MPFNNILDQSTNIEALMVMAQLINRMTNNNITGRQQISRQFTRTSSSASAASAMPPSSLELGSPLAQQLASAQYAQQWPIVSQWTPAQQWPSAQYTQQWPSAQHVQQWPSAQYVQQWPYAQETALAHDFPINYEHLLTLSSLPLSLLHPSLTPTPPSLPQIQPSTPLYLTPDPTDGSCKIWIKELDDESPANESHPELPASRYIVISPAPSHRSADSPSNSYIETVTEHSFQQHTDRSSVDEPLPATSAISTATRSYEPSTSRYFQQMTASSSEASISRSVQPPAANSFESAGESSVGGSNRRKRIYSNVRTGAGTLEPPPKRSYEPPVTRAYLPSANSSDGTPSRSLESATALKSETYSGHYFGPSTASGFVSPTASAFGQVATSGFDHSPYHHPPTAPAAIAGDTRESGIGIPSAFKPPATRAPGRSSEPPPAHMPIKWPIPEDTNILSVAYIPKPPSTPLPPRTLMPPPSSIPLPLPVPSVHMPLYSQAHMPINRANPEHVSAPPPEYRVRPEDIPLPPPRSRREAIGCPLCGTNAHNLQDCPLAAAHERLRQLRKK